MGNRGSFPVGKAGGA